MSKMSDRFMAGACEVDIAGTLSIVALQLASNQAASLVDWNNNWGDALDKCLYLYCDNWAKSLVSDIEIASAEVLGTTLGPENSWGAVSVRALSGPMTYARIDTDDRKGIVKTDTATGSSQMTRSRYLRHQGRSRSQGVAGATAAHLQARFCPPLRDHTGPHQQSLGRGLYYPSGLGDLPSPRWLSVDLSVFGGV